MSVLAETIANQGAVLRHVLDLDLAPAVVRLEGAERVWLVGTGTSEHAACLGAGMLATVGLDAHPRSAAGFVADDRKLGPEDALIVISHTTESPRLTLGRRPRLRPRPRDPRRLGR
jgi:glucosamine--fructose-6-phosphate aminotransferase (isomerizing)